MSADTPRPPSGPLSGKSVAIVHEWFEATGGAEAVFSRVADLVPHGKYFVLWRERDVERSDLHESWLARTPFRRSKALALPLMPIAWRTLTREHFDVVVSLSHAFSHTVRMGPPNGTKYLSYVHSPARYIWSPDYDRRGVGRHLTVPRRILQHVDVRMSRHVHAYAANSLEVRKRIQRYWNREADVIHPPVDVDYFSEKPDGLPGTRDYLLGVGRWIGYKNFDLMIEIAETARAPLVIAGSGPQEPALRRAATEVSVPVRFEVRPTRERLRELYWGARALLFPAHEDFGIVPVEAQACGTPVVGLDKGGVVETVRAGETGFLVPGFNAALYAEAVHKVDGLSRSVIVEHAQQFRAQAFDARMSRWLAAHT